MKYNLLYITLSFILLISLIIYAKNKLYKTNENFEKNEEIQLLKQELQKIKEKQNENNGTKCNMIPQLTRCCPDNLYSIYEDNPWIYMKNPYVDSNTTYDINWYRRDGPRLPNRINYPSQYDNCEFKQVGVITPNCQYCGFEDCKENSHNTEILPLYAKPSKYNRNNYNYYTVNNGNQNLNLQVPIEYKQRNCMEDNGCNEIYDKDIIKVPVFNKNYKVTMYPRN